MQELYNLRAKIEEVATAEEAVNARLRVIFPRGTEITHNGEVAYLNWIYIEQHVGSYRVVSGHSSTLEGATRQYDLSTKEGVADYVRNPPTTVRCFCPENISSPPELVSFIQVVSSISFG